MTLLVLCTLLGIPAGALAESGTYVVQPGDTLGAIASRYGTTVQAIVAANSLANANSVWAGQRLTIPGGAVSQGAGSRYTVKAGDNLSGIAARFGVSADAIARANNLANPNVLRLGAQLVIPPASTAASTKNAASSRNPAAGIPVNNPGNLSFVASISGQWCTLYNGRTVARQWRCSTGRPGSGTLPGTYRVRTKLLRAWGGTWGWWLPYWLGIYMVGSLENGIHGLPYSAGTGTRFWGQSIGTPVSYGCVVLDDKAAQALFNVAYVGMPVIIVR